MHISGNQYKCHRHVSVKLHMQHACNAPCIFSKDAERDVVMHKICILIDIKENHIFACNRYALMIP